MRRVAFVLTVLAALWVQFPLLATSGTENILITELYLGGVEDASQEFIELYNRNDIELALADWRVEYKSASGENWITKYTFTDDHYIQPRGFLLLSTVELELDEGNFFDTFNAGLAQGAGHIRIVEPIEEEIDSDSKVSDFIHDTVGWGAADNPEEQVAHAPQKSESIKRVVSEDGAFIDTNNNSEDFVVSPTPEPQHTRTQEEINEPPIDDIPAEEPEEPNPDSDQPEVYLSVAINELLIDPTSPQTDANDEFVELFNPHNEPINLEGYVIQTGARLQYTYEIGDVSIEPQGLVAFESRDSGLVLTNTGGSVQVLAPDGSIAAEKISYEKAKSGQSWSLIEGEFVWTTIVTPNETNKKTPVQQSVTSPAKPAPKQRVYPKVVITEVLPDPKSPLLDKNDEFIELYNPNTVAVNLVGYKIKSGKTLRTSQTIEDIVIQPGQYIVFYSADTKMSLGNSGGQAALLDPNGTTVSKVSDYTKAPSGSAWALVSGRWQWTTTPTPAARNKVTHAIKNKSSTSSTSGSIEPEVLAALAQPAAIPINQANYGLIAAATTGAILYGLYEYRFELRNHYHQHRTNRSARRAARK